MELREFEPVIRRCPVCIIDTEQRAFYAYKPDFTVRADTPTNPSFPIILEPKVNHPFNWYVVALCKRCNYLYSVFGIEQYRIKNLPPQAKVWSVNLVQTCCDICYNEEYTYKLADVFINLSSGKPVYLCDEHSKETEKDKRSENYSELNKRIDSWPKEKTVPKGVMITGEMFALDASREAILMKAYAAGNSSKEDLVGKSPEDARSLDYLVRKGLLQDRPTGMLIKKSRFFVTDKGQEVVENLQRLF